MKFTPESTAWRRAPNASPSETSPQAPPMAHAPKLTSETFQPVRPRSRYFTLLSFVLVRIHDPGRRRGHLCRAAFLNFVVPRGLGPADPNLMVLAFRAVTQEPPLRRRMGGWGVRSVSIIS